MLGETNDFIVPRQNPVPEREKAIGQRLRDIRENCLAKRSALAVRIGVSSDRLSSYEHGRVPLPWIVGDRVCEVLNVSQAWLATGHGKLDHYIPVTFSEPAKSAAQKGRFSEIYDSCFVPLIRSSRYKLTRGTKQFAQTLADLIEHVKNNPDPRQAMEQAASVMAQLEEIRLAIAKTKKITNRPHSL
ncbi:MAG TPA: helix-turn-helix transcriptional regulator [Opitutaceae bacterium]|nr:helix-turn-helix transcriptional regulator [Opitutaceae bacterium]